MDTAKMSCRIEDKCCIIYEYSRFDGKLGSSPGRPAGARRSNPGRSKPMCHRLIRSTLAPTILAKTLRSSAHANTAVS